MLLDRILTRWQCPVGSNETLNLLHLAMCVITYRRIPMAIKMASKVGVCLCCCFVCYCPCGRRGNTEQVPEDTWFNQMVRAFSLEFLLVENCPSTKLKNWFQFFLKFTIGIKSFILLSNNFWLKGIQKKNGRSVDQTTYPTVVAQWRHPVAYKVALDMPYLAMPSVLPQRTAVAIKMTNNGGPFFCHRKFAIIINLANKHSND
jgi:hypothetical protein